MKQKILITGSNGLLGQKIIDLLLKQDKYEWLATSLGENRRLNKNIPYESLDITNSNEIENLIEKFRPNYIINTAAMTLVDTCEDERIKCWNINVNAVQYLLNICKKKNIHLTQLSTDFVFDGENGPYKETDLPNPLHFYATSKYAAEQLLLNSEYDKIAIARTIIVYGLGENMSRSNVVLWAIESLQQGKEMNIVDDQFRSPTLAEDLAHGCMQIVKNNATGIYHLSGKDLMSIYDMILKIGSILNFDVSNVKPISSNTLNRAAKRPPKTGFILDKAINEIQYNPNSFEENILELWRQIQNFKN